MLYPDGTKTGVDDPPAAYERPLGPGDLRTPHFLSVPLCVIGSDFVLCVPRHMANLVAAQGGLAVVDFLEAIRTKSAQALPPDILGTLTISAISSSRKRIAWDNSYPEMRSALALRSGSSILIRLASDIELSRHR